MLGEDAEYDFYRKKVIYVIINMIILIRPRGMDI